MGSEVGVDLGGTEGAEGMSLSKSSSFWVILAAHVFIPAVLIIWIDSRVPHILGNRVGPKDLVLSVLLTNNHLIGPGYLDLGVVEFGQSPSCFILPVINWH